MAVAWVGPLHWIQWAGGHRHLIPRGWRSGPGGAARFPDRRARRPLPVASPVDVTYGCVNSAVHKGLWPKSVGCCIRAAAIARSRPGGHTGGLPGEERRVVGTGGRSHNPVAVRPVAARPRRTRPLSPTVNCPYTGPLRPFPCAAGMAAWSPQELDGSTTA
ncbi:hypothetical protein SSP35_03_00090 [Streptomyces sp. NBRC 110611]|nr:hypothetical protein SSP35_03_00090 [Streptomyces sp. NBRC 110611]